jgi:hypothetical protein
MDSLFKTLSRVECSPVSVRLRIIHHNISIGLTNTNKHFWHRCRGERFRENSSTITNIISFFFLFNFRLPTVPMDTTLIKDFSAPSELSLRPMASSKPILADAYELRPRLIEMVQTNTFLGIEDEDPYHHLQQFEQTCDCLHIEGMSDETIRWKLFPFTLKGKACQWYDRTKEKMKGDWGILRAYFCIHFYTLSKVVDLGIKIISFKQGDIESMSSSWERFELLCKFGPDLSLQDHILLQYFYIGLNKESRAYWNTSSHRSFIHLTSSEARTVLDNILASTNDGPLEETTLEEEIPEIAIPEPMLETSQPIAIQHIESPWEETPLPNFINDIEDDLFSNYGNTSKYQKVKRPRKHTSYSHEKIDPFEQTFSREHTVELVSIMSGEWLEESELSSDVVHLFSPSIPIQCTINGTSFDALYNLVVGINIMALSFFHQFIKKQAIISHNKIIKVLLKTDYSKFGNSLCLTCFSL